MNLGIYIQIPFCQTKCTYCNFHTGVFSPGLYTPYVAALCSELSGLKRFPAEIGIESMLEQVIADTLYVGGGTPSLLDPGAIAQVIETAKNSLRCELKEITLEADPETVSGEKAAAWRAAGINRISLGVQSFSDRELQSAGRLHRQSNICAAVKYLRNFGVDNISCDLIAGLPHQTEASWRESLGRLIDLHPEHVSVYLLEIDEGSRLGRESLAGGHRYSADALPSDDSVADFYDIAAKDLDAAGYEHYEISNWALPGRASQHNRKYWTRAPYLGFGAGAHSFSGKHRWANQHDPAAYVAAISSRRPCVEQFETLTPAQALEEELFLGLRLLEGIQLDRLEARYNVGLRGRFEPLVQTGLVEFANGRMRLAADKIPVSNEVFVELLGEPIS